MPRRGNTSLIAEHERPPWVAHKHRVRRFQDRLYQVIRQVREELRAESPGTRPPEWKVRHLAFLKIMSEDQRGERTDQ